MQYDYDLIVIGGGAAGLVSAVGAVGLGAKVALIEKNKLGGDCTWYGCIPSKALLHCAAAYSQSRRLDKLGIKVSEDIIYDTKGVMAHVREVVDKISTHHPPEVFAKKGIKVLFGSPKFLDQNTVELNDEKLRAKRFIIATGSHPLVPKVEGLDTVDYLTNENIFNLDELPSTIAVLGGGPIGIELAQALLKLGVKVTIIEMLDRLLVREDQEVAEVLVNSLLDEGAKILTGQKAVKFSKNGNLTSVSLEDNSGKRTIVEAERVLVAVGRAANVAGLDLKQAGVKYDVKGIKTTNTLQTTAKNIYACGDIVGPYQFSHMAEYQAIIAIGNALFPFKRRLDYTAVPWCTFTSPELAHLGLTEEEAKQQNKGIVVYRSNYNENDRAVTDLAEKGFAKVICDKKGRILGAHIVGQGAGELIHEYVLAKSAKLHIGKISSAIHIYPTLSQTVKKTADQYYMEILSCGWFKKISKFFINLIK